jgi:very-short-patch-repair endonuclease
LEAGVTIAEIKQRLRIGALIPEHRGVYRVGHRAPSTESLYLAAVKASGKGALLSGLAAAHLFGIVKGRAVPPEVITVVQRRPGGVLVHRTLRIDPLDAATWRGIPVTTVPRTLVDLAARLDIDDLVRACHEADVRHGTTPDRVEAAISRRPNASGIRELRRVLHGDVPVALSKLEKHFFSRLEEARLMLPPETNREVDGHRVDCRWPEQRLTVELDGYRYHRSRYAWEQDRRREREARARGDEFRRYTYGDVFETPAQMLAELGELLT